MIIIIEIVILVDHKLIIIVIFILLIIMFYLHFITLFLFLTYQDIFCIFFKKK
jgi:hypothetical protein